MTSARPAGPGRVRAVVQTAPRAFEVCELPRPVIGDDDALVRVEACGICGTDVERFTGAAPLRYPVIPGHEIVGVIDEIGGRAADRRGLQPGDRVAIDPFLPCTRCTWCVDGNFELCTGWGRTRSYGAMPLDDAPGLWGGYASHVYAHPNTILYPVPSHVDGALASLFNPLGAGIRWGVDLAGTTIGSTLLVLGCGQRGLACLIAARHAGASTVVVTGLARDRHKLDLARERYGATAAVDVEHDDLAQVVHDLTGGRGVDAVVDTTPHATGVVAEAVALVRPLGTIVLGGLKGRGVDAFPADAVALKGLTLRGARGVGAAAYRRAIALIAEGGVDLRSLQRHAYDLEHAAQAVRVLAADEVDGPPAVNVLVCP